MTTPEQILTILEDLLHAYPNQKLPRRTLQVYVEHLSDIHPRLLETCADNLIASSTWFPRISEIRAEARRIVGPRMVSTWEPPHNPLWTRYRQLEHDFYHERLLDSDAWLALADDFESRDQPYSAAGTRRRLTIFQQILSGENQPNYYRYSEEYLQQLYESP